MKNSSVEELMHAIEIVLMGEIYASRAITSVAMHKFAHDRNLPRGLDVLRSRDGGIRIHCGWARRRSELSISRKTIESSRATVSISSSNSATLMPKRCIAALENC